MDNITTQKADNIWIIDDDNIFAILSKRVIEISGLTKSVKTISNAETALNKIQLLIADGKSLPEIIFLDLKMPAMSGFEFLSHLEEIPQSIDTKVFIFSASITLEDRRKISGFERVQYAIEKPLTTDKLKLIEAQL